MTATRTVRKVRHTLEETAKLDVAIDRLIILVITNQTITTEMKACTHPGYTGTVEVWNIPDVARAADVPEAERVADITGYLERELGSLDKRLEGPWLEFRLSGAL